jgi:hypothetical protein
MAIVGYNKVKHFISKIANIAELKNYGNIFLSLPIPGENHTWPKFGYFHKMKGKFHIGTSGWSYKDWAGIFYPKKMKPADWLSFMQKRLTVQRSIAVFIDCHQNRQ